jgi:flagellar motor component MotA
MQVRKKTLMHAYEMRLDMILTGVLAVGSGDNPRIIEEKGKAYLS